MIIAVNNRQQAKEKTIRGQATADKQDQYNQQALRYYQQGTDNKQ